LIVGYAAYAVQGWPRGKGEAIVSSALRSELRHFVILGVVGSVAVGGLLQLTMIIAERADTPNRAGQYAAVLTLATPAALLSRSLSLVLLPSLAEARGRGDRRDAHTTTDAVTRVLLGVSAVAFGAVALCSDVVVPLFFGQGYDLAVALLPPMLFAVFASTATIGAVNSLIASGPRGVRTINGINVAGLVVGCLAWAVFVPQQGVTGVVLGYVLGCLVVGGAPYLVVWRIERHRWWLLTVKVAVAGSGVALGLLVRPSLEQRLGAGSGLLLAAIFALLATALFWSELGPARSMVRSRTRGPAL
jgi:putative peptidoglycan lipid II flippase